MECLLQTRRLLRRKVKEAFSNRGQDPNLLGRRRTSRGKIQGTGIKTVLKKPGKKKKSDPHLPVCTWSGYGCQEEAVYGADLVSQTFVKSHLQEK